MLFIGILLVFVGAAEGYNCPYNGSYYGLTNKCYIYSSAITSPTDKRTWDESRKVCLGIGADLVSVHSQEEQEFIATNFSSNYNNLYNKFWVGLHAAFIDLPYRWSDESTVNFTANLGSYPRSINDLYVAIYFTMDQWVGYNEHTTLPFVCQLSGAVTHSPPTTLAPTTIVTSSPSSTTNKSTPRPTTTTTKTTTTTTTTRTTTTKSPTTTKPITCPSSAIRFQNKCYLFGNNIMTWQAAQEECFYKHGNLVSIHSEEENRFVAEQSSKSLLGPGVFWIGLNRLFSEYSNYVWSDSSNVDYTFWNPDGAGSCMSGAQPCVSMQASSRQWFNCWHCTKSLPYVCEVNPL